MRVYSESCPPLSKRIKLLWFDTNSIEDLIALANDAVVAFWGERWPKPGIYFHGKLKKSIRVKEYGEIIVPKLETVKVLKNKSLFLENPLNSEREMGVLQMPPWNYYQLGENIDADYIVRKSGFIGPILPPIDAYKKFLREIQLCNILKGKIK